MDSSSSMEGSAPSIAEEVKFCTPKLSHPKVSLPETVVAPPSPPIAKVNSPCATAAPDTAEQIFDPVSPEPFLPSTLASETEDGFQHAEILGGDLSMNPKGDDGAAYDGHTDAASSLDRKEEPTKAKDIVDHIDDQQKVIQEEAGSSLGATIKIATPSKQRQLTVATVATAMPMPCEDLVHQNKLEAVNKVEVMNVHRPTLISRTTDLRVTPTDAPVSISNTGLDSVQNLAPKEAEVIESTEPGTETSGHIDAVKENDENEAFGDDEATIVGTPKEAPPVRSVPPHMRPTLKPANPQHFHTQDTRREWPAPIPRMSRAYYPPGGYQPSRPPLDYDELQRTKAQLMKVRNDLECERKANAETQKTVGAEKQAIIGAAMADMLTDLLHKQAEALAEKAKVQEKECDLQYREQKIAQLEDYLSEGQRQLKYQLEQQGIRPMGVVEQANLRREVELKVRHQLSDIEGKITIQVERFHHQEAAQKIREQQYKISIRDAVEAEVRAQIARDEQTKTADIKAEEVAYKGVLAEGKRIAVANTSGVALKQEFLKGYAACFRSQTALYNMRKGRVATDSPELAFLYDPTHPENLHNVGLQIGRIEGTPNKVEDNAMGATIRHKSTREDATQAVVTHQGRGQVDFSNAGPLRSTQTVENAEKAPETQRSKRLQEVQKEQLEQPIRSFVPQRSTFAGELRVSSSATSKATFASRFSSQSSPSGTSVTDALIGDGATTVGLADSVGEGVYAGRRIIRYEEDSDVEPASPNLIDLY